MTPSAQPAHRSIALIAAVAAAAVVGILVGLAWNGRGVAAVPSGSPAASAIAVAGTDPSPARTPLRSAGPNSYPSGPPTPGPCSVPPNLPEPEAPVAAPVISSAKTTLLFSSYLYRRGADGRLAARDQVGVDWAMGLWFARPGASEARLLATAPDGMVVPLGLSPAGDMAVAWWLPERRDILEPACLSGIYLIPTSGDGKSFLLTSGDWSNDRDSASAWGWGDPPDSGSPRVYGLPTASFSDDGSFVALVWPARIDVYGVDSRAVVFRDHAGTCTTWDWAAAVRNFVAACDRMTNAWGAQLGDPPLPQNLALALPAVPDNFGVEADGAIGFAPNGDLLVVRFYGQAMGCPPSGCPVPGYSVTRIDPATLESRTSAREIDFMVGGQPDWAIRLAGGGTWVYAEDNGRRAHVLNLASGQARFLDLPEGAGGSSGIVGSSVDDSLLLMQRPAEDRHLTLVLSLDGAARTVEVATIGFPDDATASDALVPPTIGLAAVLER